MFGVSNEEILTELDKMMQHARPLQKTPLHIQIDKFLYRDTEVVTFTKTSSKRRRLYTILKYGGKCVCCGNSNFRYLQLDHVNDDGRQHREQMKTKNGKYGGTQLWKWLKTNNFPPALQVLCGNCHTAKSWYGGCLPEDHEICN